ncbi:MAG: energy transducer TonB [Burkholderiaceae bacterium]|nr:energy transducer TonB [Burkholderiaceae bacterium]
MSSSALPLSPGDGLHRPAGSPAAASSTGRRETAARPLGAAPSPAPAPSRPAPLPLTAARADLAPAERRWLVAGVAGAHLLALWGLLQVESVRQTVREVAPLMVDFISSEPPPPKPVPPPPTPPQAKRLPTPLPTPLPVIVAEPTPAPAPPAFVVPAPVPAPAPVVQAPPAPPAPPAPVAPPPRPAEPKQITASSLRWQVLPPIEVPLASRRLSESGTVLLLVIFDTSGRVKSASVQRSSGFARLDAQALSAIQRSRITPYIENGQAIEVSVLAPMAYDLD